MWLVFIIATIIALSWCIKMILAKKIIFQRTFLDIPLLLFLLSQTISTIFSLDQHVSIWGYYSRFNGGLLSLASYIALYFALVSNAPSLSSSFLRKIFSSALISGLIVALWGIPSHFGYDPTCYLFRGELNVSCWTESFQPTVRIFSTLGQPAWLAAYMAVLLPIAIALFMQKNPKLSTLKTICYLLFAICFYAALIFTDTRGGFIAFWAANIFFWTTIALKKYLSLRQFIASFLTINISFLLLHFFFGSPINQLNGLTQKHIFSSQKETQSNQLEKTANVTDSGDIRLIVWKGGIEAWKKNPIFGTGVETFAFAYYRYRPKEHNLTSEWDYAYNKAHNEYINYLTTTGLFGFFAYIAIVIVFLFHVIRNILKDNIGNNNLLIVGLTAGYITVLISNFFGFSVVIINLFFFLIPALVFLLMNPEKQPEKVKTKEKLVGAQKLGLIIIIVTTIYIILMFVRFWYADVLYAKGYNDNRISNGQDAYKSLTQAVKLRGDEPVFQEELAMSNALIAQNLLEEQKATEAADHIYEAMRLSDAVITKHPNNVSFWKNRVRMLYELARIDQQFIQFAIESLEKAHSLAPTDAKLLYNLGYVYRLSGMSDIAIKTLRQTIQLKPDYRDAYLTLGLAYHDLAVNKNDVVVNQDLQKKAQESLEYVLENIASDDAEIIKTLKSWNAL